MKLYYPPNHYNASFRAQVFPLLKAFIKGELFTDIQRQEMYGVSANDFIFVDNIAEAQVVILPMAWNYYTQTKQLPLAYELIADAKQFDKVVWSINAGDFGVELSYFENLIVFRQGGYVSNNQNGHQGYPSFIDDYLTTHRLHEAYLNSKYQVEPIVGFCGLANPSKWNALNEMIKQYLRNFRSFLGFSFLEKQQILPTGYLRASLLKKLENSPSVESHFIKREQYRAGVKQDKESHKTTSEFYTNILESQYVLCFRGAGNFSVRFYETLMMGRIPLYVHTDGYLPLNEHIDWKDHVVWVDYKDRHQIATILLNFHQKLDRDSLKDIFKKNRKLWEEKLTLSGFFKEAMLHFNKEAYE